MDEHYLKQELYRLVRTDDRLWLSPRFKELFGHQSGEVPRTSDWRQKSASGSNFRLAGRRTGAD